MSRGGSKRGRTRGGSPGLHSQRSRPPLERMLRIHQAIQSGSFPNATRLAGEIEVCAKTILRDLEFMRDRLELPVAYDPVRFGYYYAGEVTGFPGLQITEGELFALLVAEKALQQYRGTPFEQPLLSAFRKMSQALPDTISLNLADWEQTISFRVSAEPVVPVEIFDALARAAAGRWQLALEYRKPGRRAAETRVVDPYHLANINGEWFLFAHCHLRRELRTFVPARIVGVRETGERFERPPGFSVEERLRHSFGVVSGQGEYGVVVRFTGLVADYVREKRWHPSQELRERADGGVDLHLRLSSLAEVQRWVLSWGGQAQVLAPPELAASVLGAARAIVAAQGAVGSDGEGCSSRKD